MLLPTFIVTFTPDWSAAASHFGQRTIFDIIVPPHTPKMVKEKEYAVEVAEKLEWMLNYFYPEALEWELKRTAVVFSQISNVKMEHNGVHLCF